MSFKLKYQSGSPVIASFNAYAAIEKDELVMIDTTNKGIIPATSSTTMVDVIGVAQEAIDASARGRVILVEPGQIWEGACTSNTAATQECIHHVLTDSKTVANTATDQAVDEGIVLMIRRVGAAADKKAEFQILRSGQVTA